mmetsp:Transcript_162/g.463  ORF Transcript_162/g.463 Transcript_162/m.463 type:complete len:92 (-) Transcript_162:208-483(-)
MLGRRCHATGCSSCQGFQDLWESPSRGQEPFGASLHVPESSELSESSEAGFLVTLRDSKDRLVKTERGKSQELRFANSAADLRSKTSLAER